MNMNYSQTSELWLKSATSKLEKAGISTARLDSLVLLEDATGKDRGWLLAHPDFQLAKGPSLSKLDEWVGRRVKHEPLAYIRGKSEFYGREFLVTADTLEPRPETETMIDLLKELITKLRSFPVEKIRPSQKEDFVILDAGTGSGCLAITIKLELPGSTVVAIDISTECIKIAKKNAKKLHADLLLYQGDLLQTTHNLKPIAYDVVLANLPYVPDSHTINKAAMRRRRPRPISPIIHTNFNAF